MKSTETGKIGENLAYEYLIRSGYLILARNHKEGFDEIDIICRHRDGDLIFCEVKTRANNGSPFNGFMPEDNLSSLKRRKMLRAAQVFLIRHTGLIKENRGWQLDLITVVLRDGKLADLHHYENI